MLFKKLQEMFKKVTLEKNYALIPEYYHPDFLLFTNEKKMNYGEFLNSHQKIYATKIEYRIEYDEETVVEQKDKIAVRMWITTVRPNEPEVRIEVMLIAQYKENKIYRIWELTFPDWSQLPAFKKSFG